jgi:cysteine desulfurase
MQKVEKARDQISKLINANKEDLIFTSGATESNNIAIIGSAKFRADHGQHLITMTTEHKAVSGPFDYLEKEGFEVTRLQPDADGLLDIKKLKKAIREDTQLVSIMHVNNEIGVIQNISEIALICRNKNVLFHCDAAQSVGKISIDLRELPIDLLSISAHKFYGPQGIGALFVREANKVKMLPITHGGEQEMWVRPGTLPLHQIIGFGVAAKLAMSRMRDDQLLMQDLSNYFFEQIRDLPDIFLNGSNKSRYPGIINIRAPRVNGESLLLLLEPLCVAQGSACNSKNIEPSLVLREIGLNDHEIQSSVRFSFTRDTTLEDIDFALEKYIGAVNRLRENYPSNNNE